MKAMQHELHCGPSQRRGQGTRQLYSSQNASVYSPLEHRTRQAALSGDSAGSLADSIRSIDLHPSQGLH